MTEIKIVELDGEFAYDQTQTMDEINSGSVLVTDDGVVGYMLDAWPVAVTLNPGQFHQIEVPIRKTEWAGPRWPTIKTAIDEVVKRGLAVHPDYLD